MTSNTIPTAYVEGHAVARHKDEAAADNYVRHTMIGDPELDPIMDELSSLPPAELHSYIGTGIEGNKDALRNAPQPLWDFFDGLEEPEWLNHDDFRKGIRAFHANVDLMLVAFVTGVLIEGFSTLISKSFSITGRVASTNRRLQQNNRHMMDIFFPGGLQRNGDGWKLSTRIRFIHARIRNLLAKSKEWSHETWGTPVSAAHLGFAISVFSRRLVEYSLRVGANLDRSEQESIIKVWRYTGYLMGIPETILYRTSDEAERMYRIGYLCEPPPDSDSVGVANMLVQAIPTVADITDPDERDKVVTLAYRLSRALIGDRLSDQYEFPKISTFMTLWSYRMRQRLQRLMSNPQTIRSDNFSQLLQISVYDDEGLSYRMPNHVHTSKSIKW